MSDNTHSQEVRQDPQENENMTEHPLPAKTLDTCDNVLLSYQKIEGSSTRIN